MCEIIVYIPCFNYGDYVTTAIESVLDQNIHNAHIVVVNDGSTDHTAAVLRVYRDHPDITIFTNLQNEGLIKVSNMVRHKTGSKYLIRLDADDWFEEFALHDLYQNAEWYNADVVYPEFYEVHRMGETVHVQHDWFDYGPMTAPHGAGCLVKRSFLDEIGGYDEDFKCQDGYYLWLQAFKQDKKILLLKEPLFNYYRHPSSLSSQSKLIQSTREKLLLKYA